MSFGFTRYSHFYKKTRSISAHSDQYICCAVTTLCFRLKVQSLIFLNPKCQSSILILWMYSPVCVRPGRKLRKQVFSRRSFYVHVACKCRLISKSVGFFCLGRKPGSVFFLLKMPLATIGGPHPTYCRISWCKGISCSSKNRSPGGC